MGRDIPSDQVGRDRSGRSRWLATTSSRRSCSTPWCATASKGCRKSTCRETYRRGSAPQTDREGPHQSSPLDQCPATRGKPDAFFSTARRRLPPCSSAMETRRRHKTGSTSSPSQPGATQSPRVRRPRRRSTCLASSQRIARCGVVSRRSSRISARWCRPKPGARSVASSRRQ